MRGTAWLLPAVLLLLVAAWAGWVELSGRAFLPRHTSARDLPYARAVRGIPEQPFNRAMTDPMNLLFPDVVFANRELREGRLPLWNEGILGGIPHAANPLTGTFYPPNLLAAWLDPLRFMLVSAALHVFLAGILFHLFLLSAGVRPLAATVGALGFALCGWIAAHLHNTPLVSVVAWVPLGLAGVEWILGTRKRVGTLFLALSIAMQWLAGFPQFAAIGTLATAVYALVSLLAMRVEPLRTRRGTGGRILGAAALGLLLASVQLLVTLDARSRSARTGAGHAQLVDESFEPGVLVGLTFPTWLGDAHEKPVTEPPVESDRDHQSRHVAARLVLGRVPGREIARINTFGERTIYAGAPIVLLAVVGLIAGRRRAAFALLVAAVLASCFACGLIPPDPLPGLLGLNVGAPGRALLVLAFVIPGLAAFGLDRLLDRTRPQRLAWSVLRIAGVLLGTLPSVAAAVAFVARDAALRRVVEGLRAVGVASVLGVTADRPLSDYMEAFGLAFDRFRRDLLWFGLFVLAAWAVLEWARRAVRDPARERRAVRIAAVSLVALTVIDLGAFFLRTVRPVVRDSSFAPTPAIEFLQAQKGRGRFARVSADRQAAIGDVHVLLPPNMGLVHGLVDAQGYRELVPARYLSLVEGTTAVASDVGAAGFTLADVRSPVLDLISARFLIAANPLEDAPGFQESGLSRVAVAGVDSRPTSNPVPPVDVVVYENKDALPFAFVVHDAQAMEDAEALARLKSGAIDPTRRIIVDHLPAQMKSVETPPSAGQVTATRIESGTISADVTLSAPGFVVIGEAWDPGWQARLWHGPWEEDRGEELEVLRANVAFMAVWVPAGHHTIKLHYWPRRLTIGIVIAATGAFVLLGWIVWPARRRVSPET